jgi:adenylate kinase
MSTQHNVILLGGPGAGKGTQAERIVADFKLPHISTGEMLRASVAKGTRMGLEAQKYMESGALVPDEVVIGVVRERLAEPDAADGFLLDGFPRTIPQAEQLDAMLAEAGRAVTHVVLIDVPADELVQRIAGRRSCAGCGKLYNVTFDPPKADGVCDVCGRELVQRADDNEDTVLESALGGGKLPDEVYAQVQQILAG